MWHGASRLRRGMWRRRPACVHVFPQRRDADGTPSAQRRDADGTPSAQRRDADGTSCPLVEHCYTPPPTGATIRLKGDTNHASDI